VTVDVIPCDFGTRVHRVSGGGVRWRRGVSAPGKPVRKTDAFGPASVSSGVAAAAIEDVLRRSLNVENDRGPSVRLVR